MSTAASEEAQAASTVKLGPLKLKTLATRPAITLESSPGMESSVMAPEPCLTSRSSSATKADRAAAGISLRAHTRASASSVRAVYTRRSLASFLAPPIELPRITATRSGLVLSEVEASSIPQSLSACAVASMARCWTESICAATGGGMRYLSGSNAKPSTKPPILE